MKYWVNIDGIQQGPLTLDELRNMEFDPEVTYVWHQDLDDWHKISELDEFADIVAYAEKRIEAKRATASVIPPLPESPTQQQTSQEEGSSPTPENTDTEQTGTIVPPIPEITTTEPAAEGNSTFKSTPPPLDYQYPKPPMVNVPPIPTAPRPLPYSYATEAVSEPQKTYIVPAILVLLFCCQATGIIATVYAALTSSSNSSGDYAKAKKYSEFAQIWIMVSIALGLVYMPISIMLIMLS